MKKTALLIVLLAAMVCGAQAKDIRVVEISTGNGMKSNYDSSIQSILKSVSGISRVVSDVTNLILTVTYDADVIAVDDIVTHINKKEPRFEAKQKGEPKTKKWVKAEKKRDKMDKKIEQERKEVDRRDNERQNPQQGGRR